jgi:hypothetical protein
MEEEKKIEEEFYHSKTFNKMTSFKTNYTGRFNVEEFMHASINEECTHATLCIPTYCK